MTEPDYLRRIHFQSGKLCEQVRSKRKAQISPLIAQIADQ